VSTGRFSTLWGAAGGQYLPGGNTMSLLEALSRGLLPATATNDPYNLTRPVLAELSTGMQSHAGALRGSQDQGTIDQGDLGGMGSTDGIFNQGGLG
jgi:hypothetical protein